MSEEERGRKRAEWGGAVKKDFTHYPSINNYMLVRVDIVSVAADKSTYGQWEAGTYVNLSETSVGGPSDVAHDGFALREWNECGSMRHRTTPTVV